MNNKNSEYMTLDSMRKNMHHSYYVLRLAVETAGLVPVYFGATSRKYFKVEEVKAAVQVWLNERKINKNSYGK